MYVSKPQFNLEETPAVVNHTEMSCAWYPLQDLVIIGLAEGVKYKGRFGSVFEWEPACYDNKNEV